MLKFISQRYTFVVVVVNDEYFPYYHLSVAKNEEKRS